MSTEKNRNIKEKINVAYNDLENLQNELKKLKTSAMSMNTINERLDKSLAEQGPNKSMAIPNVNQLQSK